MHRVALLISSNLNIPVKKRPFVRQFCPVFAYNKTAQRTMTDSPPRIRGGVRGGVSSQLNSTSDGGKFRQFVPEKTAANGGKIKNPAANKHEKRRESGNMRCRRRNAVICCFINAFTFNFLVYLHLSR
jgi:hypothetical protein